ncbi:MAG: precorrin-2 C(20)-methyltransferase, partial [Chloroflexota bacterium]
MSTVESPNFPQLIAVGLGPGDPELITVKGLKAIQAAHFIFVPYSKDGDKSLALRIAEPWLTSEQEVVQLPLPMTRNPDELVPAWEAAASQIAMCFSEKPKAKGVYLLLVDPLLYGTFTYIWSELKTQHKHIQVHVIPGITSFAATAAQMGTG